MKLLILGGSGFVSGHLARLAREHGHEVWTVTRGNRPLPAGVHGLTGDAHDAASLRAALSAAGVRWDAVGCCVGAGRCVPAAVCCAVTAGCGVTAGAGTGSESVCLT